MPKSVKAETPFSPTFQTIKRSSSGSMSMAMPFEPLLVLSNHLSDVVNSVDPRNRGHDQAAWVRGAASGRQFLGVSSPIRWAGCPVMRASTSASQA
jgi:hypothetical protein